MNETINYEITIKGDATLELLKVTSVIVEGQLLSSNWRCTYTPGQDLKEAPDCIVKTAKALWTKSVIEKYLANKPVIDEVI